MGKLTCSIDGCDRKFYGLFLCNTHYLRLRNTGTTNLRPRAPKVCRMPSCAKSAVKHRWCSTHWARVRKTGSPFAHRQKWTWEEFSECTVCGGDIPAVGEFRRYCSRSCAVLANRGHRPAASSCAQCGTEVDMTYRNERGRLVNSNLSYCRDCRKGVNLSCYVARLVERDGIACSLCGDDIDMDLKYPDPMSRSVDHVLPRSHGGTEEMGNLSLAHFRCNNMKRAQVGFKMSA